MNSILRLISGIFGIGLIFATLSMLLLNNQNKISFTTVFSGVTIGAVLLWISFNKNDIGIDQEAQKKRIQPAIWWRRFVGFFIDYLLIVLLYTLIILFVFHQTNTRLDKVINPIFLIAIVLTIYYFVQEVIFLSTIGKLFCGLRVVSKKSEKRPSLLQLFLRTIVRLVPVDFIFALSKKPNTLHDMISGTLVVKHNKNEQNV